MSTIFFILIFSSFIIALYCNKTIEFESQRYDGWYNNPSNIRIAATGNTFTRLTPSNYSDDVYRINPQTIPPQQSADLLFQNGDPNSPSVRNCSALLGFFGQFILYEISNTGHGCPVEAEKVEVRISDNSVFGNLVDSNETESAAENEKTKQEVSTKQMLYRRNSYDMTTGQSAGNPREQLNLATPIIDGSMIYGTTTLVANSIRTFENGSLATDSHFANRLADGRGHENPALYSLIVLFRDFHNQVALNLTEKLNEPLKVYGDEAVFQMARKVTIAVLQKIAYYEYLPSILNMKADQIPKYFRYDSSTDLRPSHEYVTAAGRYFMTLIPPGILLDTNRTLLNCNYGTNSKDTLLENNLTPSEILKALSVQLAEKEDSFIINGNGLVISTILSGMDHGVSNYAEVRKRLLGNINDTDPILGDTYLILGDTYPILGNADRVLTLNNLTDVNLFIGGILQTEYGAKPGNLFKEIILRTFVNLRNGDRFWYENSKRLLTDLGYWTLVNEISLTKLINQVYNISLGDNAFIAENGIFLDHVKYRNLTESCPKPAPEPKTKDLKMMVLAAFLLAVIFPLFSFGLVKIAYKRQEIKEVYMKDDGKHIKSIIANDPNYFVIYVREWLHEKCKRTVRVAVDDKGIMTFGPNSLLLRKIPFRKGGVLSLRISNEERNAKPFVLISKENDHDLVLQFTSIIVRGRFLFNVEARALKVGMEIEHEAVDAKELLRDAETREKRKKKLSEFFRRAYAMAMGSQEKQLDRRSMAAFPEDVRNVMETYITRSEFADALGMKESSPFVRMMFNVCDADQDNQLSFMEFLNSILVFVRGRSKDKLGMLFKMCDEDNSGVVSKSKLGQIFISLVDEVKSSGVHTEASEQIVAELFNSVPEIAAKETLNYDEFQLLVADKKRSKSIKLGLHLPGARMNLISNKRKLDVAPSFAYEPSSLMLDKKRGKIRQILDKYLVYVENHRQIIFAMTLFILFVIFSFTERFMHFYFMVEHSDIRYFAGTGVPIARGAGAVISFTFGLIPLTVCNHIMAMLRRTPFYQYFPLDAALEVHKIIAMTALIFSAIHSFAYLSIFYDFASEPAEFIMCIFPDNDCERRQLPFKYWFFGTLPGVTGIILFLLMLILVSFAHPSVRARAYKYFWFTHKLFWIIYALILIHGLERLTGTPRFYQFIIPSFILFMTDKIITWRVKSMRLKILKTVLHPSDVVEVRFARPASFDFLSGQWIRLRCTDLDGTASSEYHSFTLTSAPHEKFLSCHIKATGPWTWKLRNYFDPGNINADRDAGKCLMSIDGPFGGGNQEWFKYEVAIMVGGGIGITPYASILKDLVFGIYTKRYSGVACQKVYFLWICSTHKHFEWFIDLLKDVESKDISNKIEMHIFITKLYDKFDMRTLMLYICENHLKKIGKKSLFTGLAAKNHFGRPDLVNFFSHVRSKHSNAGKIGIFSCGPGAMTSSVDDACNKVNQKRLNPYFVHKYENFG